MPAMHKTITYRSEMDRERGSGTAPRAGHAGSRPAAGRELSPANPAEAECRSFWRTKSSAPRQSAPREPWGGSTRKTPAPDWAGAARNLEFAVKQAVAPASSVAPFGAGRDFQSFSRKVRRGSNPVRGAYSRIHGTSGIPSLCEQYGLMARRKARRQQPPFTPARGSGVEA
jgi:hypothetical protein